MGRGASLVAVGTKFTCFTRTKVQILTQQALTAIAGPALVLGRISTIFVEPGCVAHITPSGDVRIEVHTLVAQGPIH